MIYNEAMVKSKHQHLGCKRNHEISRITPIESTASFEHYNSPSCSYFVYEALQLLDTQDGGTK